VETLLAALRRPTAERPFQLKRALQMIARSGPAAGDGDAVATDPGRAVDLMAKSSKVRLGGAAPGKHRALTLRDVHEATAIDPWFLDQLLELVEFEEWYRALPSVDPGAIRHMKRNGFSDAQLAGLRGERESEVRGRRWALGIRPTFNVVDTCAGEFPAETPYYYSSYETEDEVRPSDGEKVVILGPCSRFGRLDSRPSW
jgi:carbamoyl-phosphate synthase large subunit